MLSQALISWGPLDIVWPMVSDQHLTRQPEECDLLSRKLFGRSPLCQVFSVFRGKDKYICKIKTLCKTTIVISYRKPAPPPDLRYQRLTQLKGKKQTEIHFTRHPVWPDDCDLLSVGRKRCLSATMRLIWGDSDPPFKQGWPVNLVFPGCIQTTTIPFSFKQQQLASFKEHTHIYVEKLFWTQSLREPPWQSCCKNVQIAFPQSHGPMDLWHFSYDDV